VFGSSAGIIYFTPGIRWNLPLHSRVSLYGTAGGDLAGIYRSSSVVINNQVSATSRVGATLAAAIGGGLDLRLSRLISLRGEARDFITERGFDGASGYHHLV
jgi:hypothetical protein